jgi:hypothetical protein
LGNTSLPLLRPLASRALTLGATSSVCESMFSRCAWLLGGKKFHSNGETLESRTFLAFNWDVLSSLNDC